jgi:hypothetical protein
LGTLWLAHSRFSSAIASALLKKPRNGARSKLPQFRAIVVAMPHCCNRATKRSQLAQSMASLPSLAAKWRERANVIAFVN